VKLASVVTGVGLTALLKIFPYMDKTAKIEMVRSMKLIPEAIFVALCSMAEEGDEDAKEMFILWRVEARYLCSHSFTQGDHSFLPENAKTSLLDFAQRYAEWWYAGRGPRYAESRHADRTIYADAISIAVMRVLKFMAAAGDADAKTAMAGSIGQVRGHADSMSQSPPSGSMSMSNYG